MSWIAVTLETDSAHAEALSDAMLELGALSVDIRDAGAGTEREQLLFGEPGEVPGETWSASEMTALFGADADIPAMMKAAIRAARLSDPPAYITTSIEEQDWVRVTQSQFGPIQISSRLWIVPSWHKSPDSSAISLMLDPGLAFGTGSHPSTWLCLAWLDENLQGGEDVLDYGCGSGILAIAAAKLGAARVIGIDIDPHAIAASRENALRNRCSEAETQFHGDFFFQGQPPADIVVANILANPLIMLAPILSRAMKPGGRIALSGILDEQAREVIEAYQQWVDMRIAGEREGWVLLSGTRK
ncbi:MAG: [LSU ribosomal protein L11P]-lysine N-methyltransferase [Nitrosospira sp.]